MAVRETLKQLEQRAAQALLDGADGAEVVKILQTRFRTLSSIDSAFSHVRKIILDRGIRPPAYDDTTLRSFLAGPNALDIAAFLDAPLKEQVRLKRAHRSNPTWRAEEEAALAAVTLLPRSMDSFGFTKRQAFVLKRQKEANLVRKNEELIVVSDAARLVEAASLALKEATTASSYPALAIPLLLVSGRRQSEIMGNGTFAHGPTPRSALFTGQLKRKGQAAESYVIPLLCTYGVFAAGMTTLRAKQALRPHDRADTYSVESRYSPDIARALKRSTLPLPVGIRCHDLRSIYFHVVFWCFVSPYSFSRTAMAVLGHDDQDSAKCYGNVRLEGAAALYGAYGPLPM